MGLLVLLVVAAALSATGTGASYVQITSHSPQSTGCTGSVLDQSFIFAYPAGECIVDRSTSSFYSCLTGAAVYRFTCSDLNCSVNCNPVTLPACDVAARKSYTCVDALPDYSSAIDWTGVYDTSDSGCDTAACCCPFGNATAYQFGTTVTVYTPVRGLCLGLSTFYFAAQVPTPTTTNVSTTILGATVTFVRRTNGNVFVQQMSAPFCSGTATLQTTELEPEQMLPMAAFWFMFVSCIVGLVAALVVCVICLVLWFRRSRQSKVTDYETIKDQSAAVND